MIPFHFKCKDADFLGVIRFSTSRRNKSKCKVHINTGADWEPVLEMDCIDTWDTDAAFYVAAWLHLYGHMDDYFGIDDYEVPNEDLTLDQFNKTLEPYGASLRVW